jgi:hypothetical protein
MIDQIRFSEFIKSFLKNNFPEFISTINYKEDGSFDCDLKNPSNQFSIWLATYNSEITIGLEDPEGKTDIHTHISCYEEEDLDNALHDLSVIINEIKSDKVILYHSDQTGYQWTNNIHSILERKKG